MASQAQHPVLILCQHALLGEGIARYVLAQSGVEATLAPAHDIDEVVAALALDPSVVIYELGEPLHQIDLNALVPDAVLIDVSMVMSRGPAVPPGASGLEKILQVVRETSGTVARPA